MLGHALPIRLHSWHASHEALHTVGQFPLALPSQSVGSRLPICPNLLPCAPHLISAGIQAFSLCL